jgi:hypothetical protein
MKKLTLIGLLSIFSVLGFAQNNFLILKKKNKGIQYFYRDSHITFQLKTNEWIQGIITKIENDSFYLTKEIIIYHTMGSDTAHFAGYHFALSDVYAIPKKGVQVDYLDGAFRINRSAGHVHWYWIKSGWIFRTGAAGYAALNVANGLIKNDFTFTGSRLGVAAGVYLFGALVHQLYTYRFKLGKKYYLQMIKTDNR